MKFYSLGELTNITSGFAWKSDGFNRSKEGLPIIRIQNMFPAESREFIYWNNEYDSAHLIKKNDLLLSMSGSFKLDIWNGPKALLNQRIAKIEIKNEKILEKKYLYYILKNSLDEIASLSTQTSIANISIGNVRSFKVKIPSLKEQQNIIKQLEQADLLLEKRRESLLKIDKLAQSIFLDMFGDPVTNSKKWESKGLLDACKLYSGATPDTTNDSYWVGKIPWFSPKDLKKDDLWDAIDHISESALEISKIKMLPKDTIVIVVRGMILVHTFPVTMLKVPGTINQDVKALLPRVDIHPQFLASCIRAQRGFILSQVSEAGHGTKRLDSEGLKKINILLPPKDLQQKFATAVEKINSLKVQSITSLTSLEKLQKSISQQFFATEL